MFFPASIQFPVFVLFLNLLGGVFAFAQMRPKLVDGHFWAFLTVGAADGVVEGWDFLELPGGLAFLGAGVVRGFPQGGTF